MQFISHVALDASGAPATEEIELAKLGTFKDPRYGKFSITLDDFKKWVANFRQLSISDGRLGIPIDVDHSPEKKGETRAVGWVKSLRIAGNRLLGKVEWNDAGRELVGDKQYGYISPSYAHNWTDEEGKAHGTMLVGAALTNRPFLRMATVSLCDSTVEGEDEDGAPVAIAPTASIHATVQLSEEVSDTHGQMPILDDIKTKLGLDADADDATILAALEQNQPGTPDVTLDQLAAKEGKVVLDAQTFSTLSANAEAGAGAAKELKETRFNTAWDKALSEGKVVPAQKEHFEGLYEAAADTTLTMLDSLQPVVNVQSRGTTTGGRSAEGISDRVLSEAAREGQQVDDDRARIATRADEIILERGGEDKISYTEAVILAESEVLGVTA